MDSMWPFLGGTDARGVSFASPPDLHEECFTAAQPEAETR